MNIYIVVLLQMIGFERLNDNGGGSAYAGDLKCLCVDYKVMAMHFQNLLAHLSDTKLSTISSYLHHVLDKLLDLSIYLSIYLSLSHDRHVIQ